jgi:hypothetical protein
LRMRFPLRARHRCPIVGAGRRPSRSGNRARRDCPSGDGGSRNPECQGRGGRAGPGFQYHWRAHADPDGRIAFAAGRSARRRPSVAVLLDGTNSEGRTRSSGPIWGICSPPSHARQPGFAFTPDREILAGEHLSRFAYRKDGQIHELWFRAGMEARVAQTTPTSFCTSTPHVVGGAASAGSRQSEISGWALAKGCCGDRHRHRRRKVAPADYGLRRLDIQAPFPMGRRPRQRLPGTAAASHPAQGRSRSRHLRDKAPRRSAFAVAVEELRRPGPWALRRRGAGRNRPLPGHVRRSGRQPMFAIMLPVDDESHSAGRCNDRSLCARHIRTGGLDVPGEPEAPPMGIGCRPPGLNGRARWFAISPPDPRRRRGGRGVFHRAVGRRRTRG